MNACYMICCIRSETKFFIHAFKNEGHFLTMILIFIFLLPSIALSEESASISGKVFDKETGKGIADVALNLKRIDLKRVNLDMNQIETKTDANGDYLFKDIILGEYYIDAIPSNPYCKDLFYIDIKKGEKLVFNIELVVGGTLSGKIYMNKVGIPFPGVRIVVSNNYCQEEGITDTNGIYHVGGLRLNMPGEEDVAYIYNLMIDTQIEGYALRYFKRVLIANKHLLEFKDILIDLNDLTGINGFFLSMLDEKPIELMRIEIEDEHKNPMGNVLSDQRGFFTMRGLEPGNYTIYFKPLLWSNEFAAKYSTPSDYRANRKVTVIRGKNPDLNIKLDIPSFTFKKKLRSRK